MLPKILSRCVLALALFGAVGGTGRATPPGPSAPPAPEPRRIVTDMCGRQVSLPARIRRVITAGEGCPAMNAHLFALGQADTIVNGLPVIPHPPWKYQLVFAPRMSRQPAVAPPSGMPFLEVLQGMPHDVVLVKTPLLAHLLSERGFTTACLFWRGKEGIVTSIRSLGEIMNCPDRAQAYLDYYQDVVRRVAAREADLPLSQRRTVLYLQVSPLQAGALSTASTTVLRAGGRYAPLPDLSLENQVLDPEQLLVLDPDVILVRNGQEKARLLADPRFSLLRAVQGRTVVVVPYGALAWTHATPEQALGILWLAKLLYPKRFADVDMAGEARAFYHRFFGTDLTEAQLQDILRPAPEPPAAGRAEAPPAP